MEQPSQESSPAKLTRGARFLPPAGLALFLLLVGWYALTMSGHTYSPDEETLLATAEGLIDRGSFTVSPDLPLMQRSPGLDGQTYSRYGPGQPVVAIPFVEAGRLLGRILPDSSHLNLRLVALLLPVLVTAATASILYSWVRIIGFPARVALLVGLLFGLTSLAWPYSRTFFSETLNAFFLVLAAYGMRRRERSWWAIAGAALAAALAVKFQSLLAVPLIAGYAATVSWNHAQQRFVPALAGRFGFALAGMALPLALVLLYNQLSFGGVLSSGYGGLLSGELSNALRGSWLEGLYGQTLSTGKGLLLYSPTIALGLAGVAFYRHRHWRESILGLGMLIFHVGFYSPITYWHAGAGWGPRYLVVILPFLYLPAAGLLATVLSRERRHWLAGAGALAVLSFGVQTLPVLVNTDVYVVTTDERKLLFEPASSPIIGHARIFGERLSEWRDRLSPPAGTAAIVNGFSYSEGDRSKGELFPRWTKSDGIVRLYPQTGDTIEGKMVLIDHRPWPMPRAEFSLHLNGAPLEGVRRLDLTGQGVKWELDFELPGAQVRREAELVLRSDLWNPSVATTDNPRDEDLGMYVESIELKQNGGVLEVVETLPIPKAPENSRYWLWHWYLDASIPHLLDTWFWYLLVSGIPRRAVALLLAGIGVPALVCFVEGLRGVVASLRTGRG